jgi:HSP20 family protein
MLNNIFNDGWNGMPSNKSNTIAVDVNENDKAFIMTADFPGFDKKDVSLKAEESVLTLSANRDSDIESNDGSYRIRERRTGSFSRSFNLPENVLVENINAKFKNGSLTITIPKAEEVKPDIHQIKIG